MKSPNRLPTRLHYVVSLSILWVGLTPARAGTDVIEYQGHLYQHFDSHQYWEEAQASCETLNAHLVTIGSAGENEFVFDNFVAIGNSGWLGGTDRDSEGDWKWVTGEPWSYTNWCPWCTGDSGDPDADYLTMGDHRQDVWYRDVSAGHTVRSFICEWDSQAPERILSFAHFGTGAGLQFDLVLVNPSKSVTATGTIRFWDPSGNSLDPSGFLSEGVDFDLPPQGSKTLSADGTGEVVTGSITVHSNVPVSGVERFFLPNAGLAGVGTGEPQESAIVPVRREGGTSTGVAIRNAWQSGVTVDLTLQDESGQPVANGNAVLNIPVNGRVSAFLQEYFPDADTSNFRGSMLIESRTRGHSSEPLQVIGLELEVGGTSPKFTTLPVEPVSHEKYLPDLTPRRPEGWSNKIVVSRTTGTHSDSPDLTSEDTLYVDYAVVNHGKVAMAESFQTDLLIDDVVIASDVSEPPLEPGGWVQWLDRPIGMLSPGGHSISVLVHGVPGSDYTDCQYKRFITVIGNYDGTWTGTTAQERPLSFKVEEGRVTLVTLDVRIPGTACTATISGGIQVSPGATVSNGAFVWSYSDPWGASATLSGSFSSLTAASGTLAATSQNCNGSVVINWSAVKE